MDFKVAAIDFEKRLNRLADEGRFKHCWKLVFDDEEATFHINPDSADCCPMSVRLEAGYVFLSLPVGAPVEWVIGDSGLWEDKLDQVLDFVSKIMNGQIAHVFKSCLNGNRIITVFGSGRSAKKVTYGSLLPCLKVSERRQTYKHYPMC